MSTQTATRFDLAKLARAIEQRDAQAQVEMYADDATVTIADRNTQPGSPRALNGRDEISAWIEDTSSRDMTHAVQPTVQDDTGAAFIQSCRYPDGAAVLCATVLELSGGLIARQTVVQAWDEKEQDR